MSALQPKPPLVIIPDLGNSENFFCGLCLVINTGHLELLHHNISAKHVKKLKKACIRLQSECTICRVNISDIKAAEAHVQGSRHEERMKCDFNLKEAVSVADQTYECSPCHLVFNCFIALQLHWLMTHKVRFSKENLPELSEIIWLLSGSSVDTSKVNINPECGLCNLSCEAMDDFLTHLFSNEHMKLLRTSTCIVCERKFIHVNDRESHLHSNNHNNNLHKFCLAKRLRKLDEMEKVESIGYICMYCMIWCKSWPCFILHFIGNAHIACAENQDKKQIVLHAELQAQTVETDENSPVSSVSGKKLKRWLDQSAALSAWCLVCEEMVSTPETLEKHLQGHNGHKSIHIKNKNHRINTLLKEGKACDYLECEVCSVIFKNGFSLRLHKAFRQHHIQQALVLNGGILCSCYDCRMRGRSIAVERISLPKSNSVIVNDDKLEENETTVQNHSAEELNSEVHRESSVKMFPQTSQSAHLKDNNEVHELYGGVDKTSPPGEKTEIDANHQVKEDHNSEHLSGCHETNVLVCQKQTQRMVPVVIAAALPPSNSIHNSIQSALKLVKESLSAAIPKIRKSSSEVVSANKRLKGNIIYDTTEDKHDCRILQPIIEDAVTEGLRAFISQSCLSEASTSIQKSDNNKTCEMPDGSCGTPVSVSIENIGGISVAFAAAIIPQYSTTQIALQPCTTNRKHTSFPRSNHEKEHETSIDHQEISRLRKVFAETNSNDAKLCIQDSTQRSNIVYEDDTSADSD